MTDIDLPHPPDPRIGSLLQGRYRVLSKIASGAMGVVYRGERVQLGRPVAVKFLHPWIAAQKSFLNRFENEAKAMSRLLHPHCVSVIDFGVEGAPFLVMDFVTGRTLRELTFDGRLPVGRALRIVQQLLAGLAHAHAQGIVHRDLKPENLILSDEEGMEEHLRILDFGLAKLRDGPAMTAGMAVGTPSYMSPEQSGAEGAIDARTDLYAVGIVLFELLTGRKPFQSENVGELILMQRETPPPLLRATAPDARYSAQLEALVAKAMAKLPADRFQSAGELAAAIDATPEGRAIARPAPKAEKPPAGRPAPAGKTTVDTVSAVRRRMAADGVGGGPASAPGESSAERPGPVRQWRLAALGGGLVVFVMLALLVGRGFRHQGADASPAASGGPVSGAMAPARQEAPRPVSGAPAAAPAAAARPAADSARLEEVRQLIARKEIEQALALLNQLRAAEPDNADVLYLQAMVYLDNHRWAEGLAAAQLAVRRDPTLKADGDLIRGAIRSLASDRGYERTQAFLRGLGQPAVPFIKEAAQHDPSPTVRQRAADLLGGSGGGGGHWPARSSGSSMFKR